MKPNSLIIQSQFSLLLINSCIHIERKHLSPGMLARQDRHGGLILSVLPGRKEEADLRIVARLTGGWAWYLGWPNTQHPTLERCK